jgi:hypothetical protein
VQSPDGEWEAVVYTLDCGALAATRINVSIIEAGDSDPEEFGNVYMSRCTGWPLKCFWRSNSKLVIARPDEPDAKARPCPTWNGITITYEFLE